MDQVFVNVTTSGVAAIGGYLDEQGGYGVDPTESITDSGFYNSQYSFVVFDLQDLPPYVTAALQNGSVQLIVNFTTDTSNVSTVTVHTYAVSSDANGDAIPNFLADPSSSTANYAAYALTSNSSDSLDSVSVRHSFGAGVPAENENAVQSVNLTQQAISALASGNNLVVFFNASGGDVASSTNITGVSATISGVAEEPASYDNGSTVTYVGSVPTQPFSAVTLSSQIPPSLTSATVTFPYESPGETSTPFFDNSTAVTGTEYFLITQSVASAGVLSGAGITATKEFISSGQAGYLLSGNAASVTAILDGLVFTPAAGSDTLPDATTLTLSELNGPPGAEAGAPVSAGSVEVFTGSAVSQSAYATAVEIVTSGGTAIGTSLDGYAAGDGVNNALYQGTQIISSGGVASYTVVSAGYVDVLGGGVTVSTDLLYGDQFGINGLESVAEETVSSGGVASGTIIGDAALQIVSSGGDAVSALLQNNGHQTVLSGGTAAATQIGGGGRETVSAGGTDENAVISQGGSLYDYGKSDFASVFGTQYVEAGATASKADIQPGGLQYDYGSSVGARVISGGAQYVVSGGVASGTELSGTVSGGFFNLLNGTYEIVSGGGSTVSTTAVSGGAEIVGSDGSATSTIVENGGSATVQSGGTATDLNLAGGTATFEAGAQASGFVLFKRASTLNLALLGPSGASSFDTPISGLGSVLSLPTLSADATSGTDLSFGDGTSIDLPNVAFEPGGSVNMLSGNTLYVQESSDYFIQLDPKAAFAGQYDTLSTPGGGLSANPCYCRGSAIRTAAGDVPVEALRAGDIILTQDGQRRPVIWIGQRSYAGRFLRANAHVQPVCFRSGSLGGGLPYRDLMVSPDHAMYLDGLLVPARCLVNGATVVRMEGLDRVDYFHVELDQHDVLLAEGAPSESFLDDGSRQVFQNADKRDVPDNSAVKPGYCARRVESGHELEAIRQRIARTVVSRSRAA